MADDREVADTLDDRPELETALETIEDTVGDTRGWTFEDVPIDSGTFGEVVSENLVEKTDEGYHLPETTRQALNGELAADDETIPANLSMPTVDIDRRGAGALAGALAVVFLFRTVFSYGAVFRNGDVVLSGNDPYAYRFYVEQLLATHDGGFEFAGLSSVPISNGEPLYVSSLWWAGSVIGDGAAAAGTALAWYPVISALISGVLVYLLAVALTDDRRVGLATVVFLATIPGHAMRTSLGYADHHAFDYPWLALTALFLVLLTQRDETAIRDPRAWALGLGFGFGITGQVLAWEAGPALIFPIAVCVPLLVLLDVAANRSPLLTNAPLVGGLGVAAILTWLAHTELGWHTDFVTYAPALLFAGSLGVVLFTEAMFRLDFSARLSAGIELGSALAGVVVLRVAFPTFWTDASARFDGFFRNRGIVETQALFSGDLLWFLLLGLVIVLMLPPLVWASKRAKDGDKPWLVASAYAWYFLILASFQVRFIGELAAFSALFGGFGFVWLAHWVDLGAAPGGLRAQSVAKPRRDGGPEKEETGLSLPSIRDAGLILALFLLVGAVGIMQVPVKTGHLTMGATEYQAAAWIGEDAAAKDRSDSDSYVLSTWGRNRMYNYFANGDSRTYNYARQTYQPFATATNGERWYERINGRVGYIITTDRGTAEKALLSRLHEGYGSRSGNIEALTHYRAVYASPDKSIKVFTPVPGAQMAGRSDTNGTVTVEGDISITGASFTYKKQVSTTENGWYVTRVPHVGTYGTDGGTQTEVTEDDVLNGSLANEPTGEGYWPFDEGSGSHVFDHVSGYPGTVENGSWDDGIRNQSLTLRKDGYATVPAAYFNSTDEFTLSVWFRTNESSNNRSEVPSQRLATRAGDSTYEETNGYQLGISDGRIIGAIGNGSDGATQINGPAVDDGTWHHAVLVWDGTTARLAIDGQTVGNGTYQGELPTEPLVFGATSDKTQFFHGRIDEARHYDRALTRSEIQDLYAQAQN